MIVLFTKDMGVETVHEYYSICLDKQVRFLAILYIMTFSKLTQE